MLTTSMSIKGLRFYLQRKRVDCMSLKNNFGKKLSFDFIFIVNYWRGSKYRKRLKKTEIK